MLLFHIEVNKNSYNDAFDCLAPVMRVLTASLKLTLHIALAYSIIAHKLTPWCQNQNVHHRVHNSLPPVLIVSQVNPHAPNQSPQDTS
jgi:hypothetical protein